MSIVHCPSLSILLVLLASMDLVTAQQGKMLPRQINGDLPIVVGGAPQAVIVAPSDADMRTVAEDLAATLREQTGLAVPLVEDKAVVGQDGRTVTEEFRGRHLILVGNALNNRAILPLYGRWLDASDGRYPGGEGYELRTVVNPYGTQRQELILGASTAPGARRGLEALKQKLKSARKGNDLVLPQMLEVQVGPELKPAFDQALAEVKANPERSIGAVVTNGHLAEFCNDALRYAWTGEVAFAQRARGVLLEMNRRFDGGYYHGDIRTCDDYALEYAVRGWMTLQHAGVLGREELWETDRNLFHDVPFSAHGAGGVGSRHLASGSMAFFLLVDGLLTYGNPDESARQTLTNWRDGVRAYFHGACQTYRGDVDQAQDYGAMENVFRYAMHDGYWEYFDSGWADKTITQMLMNVDNFGSYSGVGGYGEAMPGSLNYPVAIGVALPMTAFVERRGDLRWIYENVPNLSGSHLGFMVLGVHGFSMGTAVPATPPHGELTGLTSLPLDQYHYQLGQRSEVTEGVGPITTPRESAVDKLMFRDGFRRQDQYLLLNGYQATVMGCVDGNAIVRFCDRGQTWLFQSTQEEGHYTKNAVFVSNGKNTDLLEGCVELRHAADLGPVCFSSTVLPRYHGTDWRRTIFWRRGSAFVVFDHVTVRDPGTYSMACTWRSPRYARLEEEGSWRARAESGSFTLRPAEVSGKRVEWESETLSDSRQEITADPRHTRASELPYRLQLTNSLDDDRFTAEVPWVLRQWKRSSAGRDLKPGQVVAFQNVLFVTSDGDQQDYSLRRLSDRAALLSGSRQTTRGREKELSLLALGPQEFRGKLAVEADLCWIGNLDLSFVGLRSLTVAGRFGVETDAPVNLSLSPATNGLEGLVEAAGQTHLTLTLPGLTEAILDGGPPTSAQNSSAELSIPAGRHTLVCRGVARDLWDSVTAVLKDLDSTKAKTRAVELSAINSQRSVPKAKLQSSLPVRSLWTYDGLRDKGGTVRGLRVTSSVDGGPFRDGPQSIVGDTFNSAQASWNASRVEVNLDLPQVIRISDLRFTLFVGAVDFNKEKPNPVRVTQIAVSNDGFHKDVRVIERPMRRSYHYRRPFYGGSFYGEVVDAVEGLNEKARAVRLTLEPAEGSQVLRLGRVQVLCESLPDSVPLRCQAVEMRQTGETQWSVWNPETGHLRLIDSHGRELWRRDFGAAITGVACDDVDGDGSKELAVTSADWYLSVLNAEGKEVMQRDWRGLYESTGGKYYYGACPHGVGIYSRPGQKEKEMAVGHYYFLSYLKSNGAITKTVEDNACFWQDFLNTKVDLNGDGAPELLCYSETPWQTRVPILVLDGVTQEVLFSFAAGNGGARLLQMVKVGNEDCVAFGSHKGCGLYSLTQRALKWYLGGEVPKTSFFITDLEGDGSPEMLVGQRDGFLLVVNLKGEVVQQWNLGEEIVAVGALPGPRGPRVLVSTHQGTRMYDAQGRPVGQSSLVAQRFEPATSEDRSGLLALHKDGRVELLKADH